MLTSLPAQVSSKQNTFAVYEIGSNLLLHLKVRLYIGIGLKRGVFKITAKRKEESRIDTLHF
jgi:hypothetical protein